jgi:thioredoxin 2
MSIVRCSKCGTSNRVVERSGLRPVCGRCGTKLLTEQSADEGRPLTVSDQSFDQIVASAGSRPLLIDCWAEWCGPCRMIAPIMDQLANEAGGRYLVAKLNVDENPRTSAQFGIQSIPTLLIFKNGKLIDRLTGLQPKQIISARLEAYT